ncbi:MAG: Gfo/Idh/MocA family oxidoreductase [Anaerolineales bacterium]|jgi:predicted dehydrogenase
MAATVKVGIVGCGNVSNQYLHNLKTFDILEVKSLTDVDMGKAAARASEFNLQAVTLGELLSDRQIQIVVNLTVPSAHAEVSLQIINAGKNTYSEKPLALTRTDGRRILDAAREKGVLVGCAPDTFLGGGLQTCREVIDAGWIGSPVAATAFFATHGPESWHPNPQFFYKPGAGPVFDLGPYMLTALVSLFGPARRVTSSAHISFPERQILSQPFYGSQIKVEVPTHVAGVIDFSSGVVASVITSFDIWHSSQPNIEIFGTEGTLIMPGPNKFTGPVRIRRAAEDHWSEIPLSGNPQAGRGIGIADLACALIHSRKPRASGDLAYHVLDLMHAIIEASDSGQHVIVESSCERPEPLPHGPCPQEPD